MKISQSNGQRLRLSKKKRRRDRRLFLRFPDILRGTSSPQQPQLQLSAQAMVGSPVVMVTP